jgi:nucleotide-binding universal stress UspA family protein
MGTGFRHILVPTDLTERTQKALQLAEKLAGPDTVRITLVHVIATIDGLEFDELQPFYDRLERKARAEMTERVRHAGAARSECAVVYGRAHEEIVRFAATHNVDLIVLASHRVDPSMANRDWGTISYKVGILAQCPVLLVK